MSVDLERRVRELERQLEKLETIGTGTNIAHSGVASDPPTDAELDASFGSVYDGFIAGFTSASGTEYLVLFSINVWAYVELTQAV